MDGIEAAAGPPPLPPPSRTAGTVTSTRGGRRPPAPANDASNIWHVFSFVLPATAVWRAKEGRLQSLWHPIGGFRWRIFLYPRGNQQTSDLSVYIECGGPVASPAAEGGDASLPRLRRGSSWTRPTAFKLVLIRPPVGDAGGSGVGTADGVRPSDFFKDATHVFTPKESDWGFKDFIALSSVRPARGVSLSDAPALHIDAHVQLVASVGPITVLPDWDSRAETGYVGLRNQGATCYLNSLLQMLYCVPGFRRLVYALPIPPPEGTPGADKVPASVYQCHELQKVFHGLQTAPTAVRTKRLTESFGWDSAELFQQHDAQELNRILCDRLSVAATNRSFLVATADDEDEAERGGLTDATPRDGDGPRRLPDENAVGLPLPRDFVETLFQGRTANVIRCLDVAYSSERGESFFDISLTVSGLRGVLEAFAAYTQVELMDGDNRVRADGFDELQRAEKGVRFTSLPPVLQLHLKRFDYDFARDPPVQVKINDYFEYGDEIDLSPFVKGPDGVPGGGDDVYVLHTVLVHIGDVDTGHYCAYIRPDGPGGSWLKFDDETVTCVSAADALDANYGFGGPHQPPLPPPVVLTESPTGLSPPPLPPVPSPQSRPSSSPPRVVRSPSPEIDVSNMLNDGTDVMGVHLPRIFRGEGNFDGEENYNVITAATDATGLNTNTPDPPVAEITTGETTSPSPSSVPSASLPLPDAPVVRTIRARPPNCRFSSAYMLQYVRKDRVKDLLQPEDEVPALLTARIADDQAAEAARRARAADAHLYRDVFVATDAHLKEHVTGDLLCWSKIPPIRVRRDGTLLDLKRALIRAGVVSRWQPAQEAKSAPVAESSSPATVKSGDPQEEPTTTTHASDRDIPKAKRRKDVPAASPAVDVDGDADGDGMKAMEPTKAPVVAGGDDNASDGSRDEDDAEAIGWLRLWKCSGRENSTTRPEGLVANGVDDGVLEPPAAPLRITRSSTPRPAADELRIYAQVLTGPDLIADRDGLYSTHTFESSSITPPSGSPSLESPSPGAAPPADGMVRAVGDKLPLGKRKRSSHVPRRWPVAPPDAALFFVKQYLPHEARLVFRGTFLAWKDGFVRGLIPAAVRVCGLTVPPGQTADAVATVYEEVKLETVEPVSPFMTLVRAELNLGGDILVVELKLHANEVSATLALPRAEQQPSLSASQRTEVPLGGRPMPTALHYYNYLRYAVIVEFRERWSSDFVGSQGTFTLELLSTDSLDVVLEEAAAALRLSVPANQLRFFAHDDFSDFARPERLFASSHPTLANMLPNITPVTGSWLTSSSTPLGGPELDSRSPAAVADTPATPPTRGPSLSAIGRRVGLSTLQANNAVLSKGILWYEVAEFGPREFAGNAEVRIVYRPDGGAVEASAAASAAAMDKVTVESGVTVTRPVSFSVLVPRHSTYGRVLTAVRERLSLGRGTRLRLLDIRGHIVDTPVDASEVVEPNPHMVEPGTELRVEPIRVDERVSTDASLVVADGSGMPPSAKLVVPILHVAARRNAAPSARTDAPVFFGTPVMLAVPRGGLTVAALRDAVANRLGVKPDVFASWRVGECIDGRASWFEDEAEVWDTARRAIAPHLVCLAVEHVRTGGGAAAGGRGYGVAGARKVSTGLSRLPDKPLLIRS